MTVYIIIVMHGYKILQVRVYELVVLFYIYNRIAVPFMSSGYAIWHGSRHFRLYGENQWQLLTYISDNGVISDLYIIVSLHRN